jgi:ATP-dependent helicase/nuclease subunit A
VVLSSGAGCGKTTVLTDRYLAHLEEGATVSQVAAITFTERAAREMRERIRKEITRRLRAATNNTEVDLWAGHLRDLETAPISTIHAFCAALLRQFAIEARLDPRFEVLEDVLSVNLEAEAISRCLQTSLTMDSLEGKALRELVSLYGWRPVNGAIAYLVGNRDEQGWQKGLQEEPHAIAKRWETQDRTAFVPAYVRQFVESCSSFTRCLDLLNRHPPLPGPMVDQVALLQRHLLSLDKSSDLSAVVGHLIHAAKVSHLGKRAWPDNSIYEQIKVSFNKVRSDLRRLDLARFVVPDSGLLDAAEVGLKFLRVAAAAAKAYGVAKREHGVLDFQDLLVLGCDLLVNQNRVRHQVQDSYRHILIDELQDTDPVQMKLVDALCGGHLTNGKLFAVGDHKQSIYRFRGADVSLFKGLRNRLSISGQLSLTLNFRSQPAILNFVNALFAEVLEHYEPLVSHRSQVAPNGVEFCWTAYPSKAPVAEARAAEAAKIAERLAAMIGQEELVWDDQTASLREVQARDIVLLLRSMSNVHLYEEALRKRGIDYYLVGGRAFFAQQEIHDIANLLRALENPQDSVCLAGALRSPFCCLSDESLFILGRTKEGLWTGLHDVERETHLPADQLETVRRARKFLLRWRSIKDRLPIARLLGAIFADSGYDAATQFEFLGDRKLANLWKLQDLARTFDRSGLFGLADFIARLGDLVKTQPREEQAATQPEESNVVRLMSIHQAKGLEFPVVFVADTGAERGPSSRSIVEWDPDLGCVPRPAKDEEDQPFPEFAYDLWEAKADLAEWQEELRIFYVACTRAKDYLVLSASLLEDYQSRGPWMQTLARCFDLQTGKFLGQQSAEPNPPRVAFWSSPIIDPR